MSEERINGQLVGSYDSLVISGSGALSLDIDHTTAATSGNVSSVDLDYTNTANGINNMRLLTADLTLGANCNGPYAGYFRTDNADATVGGLSAALGMELVLSSVASANGEAHGMTIDIACPSGSQAGAATNKHSFIKMEIWGNTTAKNLFDDQWNLFFLNGLTGADDNLFNDSFSENTPEIEASLRININGTSWYIPLMDQKNGA